MRLMAQPQPGPLPPGGVAAPITCLAPVGSCIAAAAAATELLFDPAGSSPPTVLLPGATAGKPIICLAASRDGRLVAAGERGAKACAWVWRLDGCAASAEAIEVGRGQHTFGIASLAFCPSGRLLASHGADKDQQLALWSPASGALLGQERVRERYDAVRMASEERLACINATALVIWGIERCTTGPSGSLKLARQASYALPALPSPTSAMVGLASLPGAGARAPMHLACTDGGRLLRLRARGPTVDKSADVQAGKVLGMAATPDLVATACASGQVCLFCAATLEPVAVLPAPAQLGGASAAAAAFSDSGKVLTVAYRAGGCGTGLASWDVSDPLRPALLERSLRPCHSDAITDVVAVPTFPAAELLATASLDGTVRLWACAPSGALSSVGALDLASPPSAVPSKLVCLAASPDGQVLAVGGSAGAVHLVSLASPAAPTLLCTQDVFAGDAVTALSMAEHGGGLFLAVGSRRGEAEVLLVEQDQAAAVGSVPHSHKGAITGLLASPHAGGMRLVSCGTDGRHLVRSVLFAGACPTQLGPEVATTVPRASFVGLAAAGPVAVAATADGRVHWQAQGAEISAQALDKRSGAKLASFAVDPALSLLAAATTRNQLLLHSLAGGRATPIASSRAHLKGTAITKVIILPASGCVVTVGEDASVCTHRLPSDAAASCSERTGALRCAAFREASAAASQAAPTASMASSGLSSAILPRRLSPDLLSNASCTDSPPSSSAAHTAAAAAVEAPLPAAAGTGLARAASIPPSPNRTGTLAGLRSQQQELDELAARWATMRSQSVGNLGRQAPPAPPTASPGSPGGTPAATARSPSFFWGGAVPDATLSAISLGALRSPDIFSDIDSPAGAHAASGRSPPPAAPAASPPPATASPAPASVGSTKGSSGGGMAATLRRLTASARWDGLLRHKSGGASGSTTKARASSQGVGDALDAADAARTRALLAMSDGGGVEAWPAAAAAGPGAEASPAAGACCSLTDPCSATVDLAGGPGQPGSASVNQPRRRWGAVPPSAGLRRSASSLEVPLEAEPGTAATLRPHSTLGLVSEADSFGVCGDASSAKGAPGAAARPSSSGGTSRRLEFSFTRGAGHGGAAQPSNGQEVTPTLGAKPSGPAATQQPLPAFNPAAYTSPGLPAQQQPGAAGVTPRIFLGVPAAPAPPPGPLPTADVPTAAAAPTAAPAGGDAAPTHAEPAVQAARPRGLQGRPAVPRLNLKAWGAALAAGAAAPTDATPPAAAAHAKRPRQASTASGFPADSGASSAGESSQTCGRHGGAASQLPTAAGNESPGGKKQRAGMSPLHFVVNCQLYSPSPNKAQPGTSGSGGYRTAAAWPAVAGGGFAAPPPHSGADTWTPGSDPFGRPAAHDPVQEEESTWERQAGLCPRPAPSDAHITPSAVCDAAAASPPSRGRSSAAPRSSPSARARSSASGSSGYSRSEDEETSSAVPAPAAPMPAATTPAALELLRQGVAMLAGLGGTTLDEGAKAELAGLAAQLQRVAGLEPAPASALAPTPQPASAGRENASSNGGGGIWRADLEALKAEVMAELRAELRSGGR